MPPEVRTVQRCAAASHSALSTLVSKTKRSRVPDRLATFWMYAWISGCGEYDEDQSGFRANENE